MPEAGLYTASAKKKGKVKLPDEFGVAVSKAVIYDAVRAYLSNQRQGSHATKNRAAVSGGTHKPWRQKGTGRARQGTIRAPQFRGGGVVFGPHPRSYRIDLPRKVKVKARNSALSARAAEGAVYVIESLDFDAPKTATLLKLLRQIGVADQKVLLLTNGNRPEVFLSGRNLRNVLVLRYSDVCAYDVMWSAAVVIEKEALAGDSVAEITRPPRSVKKPRGVAKQTKRKSRDDA